MASKGLSTGPIILILALLGIPALLVGCSLGKAEDKSSTLDRDLVTVRKVDYPVLVSASGVLEAEKNVSIGPPRIPNEHRFRLARLVEEGKEVSEGDFLLEFDGSDISRRMRDETAQYQRVQQEYQKKRSDFEVQTREMRLQLEQAKADMEKLDNKLSQQQELESRIQVEETRLRRDQARRRYELLQKKAQAVEESGRLNLQLSRSNENNYKRRIDRLQDAMDSLTVRAPVPGVVIYRKDWSGEAKQVGSFVFLMDVVVDLPDLKTLRVKAMVDEVDAGKVRAGQPAKVQVDAVQGRIVDGVVTGISGILKQASFDRPQRIAEVFIRLTDSNLGQMRPGMSAKSQIEVDRYPEVLVIPMACILEREGHSFVQLVNTTSGKTESREVEIRTSDGTTAVIRSGLSAGDKIRAKPKLSA